MQEKTLEEIEEWPNIHPLLWKHMDCHMFDDDQIGIINEMLEKAREEGRKEGYKQQWMPNYEKALKEEIITQYKEELKGKLPEEMKAKCKVKYDKDGEVKSYQYYNSSIAKGFNDCLSTIKELLK